MARMKVIERRGELLRRLGTAPDNVLAKEFGLSRERLRQLRKEMGIPVFHKPRKAYIKKAQVEKARRQREREKVKLYKKELSALVKYDVSSRG